MTVRRTCLAPGYPTPDSPQCRRRSAISVVFRRAPSLLLSPPSRLSPARPRSVCLTQESQRRLRREREGGKQRQEPPPRGLEDGGWDGEEEAEAAAAAGTGLWEKAAGLFAQARLRETPPPPPRPREAPLSPPPQPPLGAGSPPPDSPLPRRREMDVGAAALPPPTEPRRPRLEAPPRS
ncbi:Hypothetical predicted protein [Podarcis lilfordi]|uniref:Uncharacterized protein n=1 Tax=Podarcis lilfordi TaxID=74358 RepID=A0AA35KKH0_9SAUR|nr:Hypothetical predicted protein [Podarcis lilfordi]